MSNQIGELLTGRNINSGPLEEREIALDSYVHKEINIWPVMDRALR